MKYDTIRYWNTRKCPNSASNLITIKHINFIRKRINKNDRILDVGPGIGRLMPAFENMDEMWGFDISDKYKHRLLKKSRKYNIRYHLTVQKYIDILPYENDEFDVVICVSVLMHQRPDDILKVISEIFRVGKKGIIITGCYENDINLAAHCFNHNYADIFDDIGADILEYNINRKDKQLYAIIS